MQRTRALDYDFQKVLKWEFPKMGDPDIVPSKVGSLL